LQARKVDDNVTSQVMDTLQIEDSQVDSTFLSLLPAPKEFNKIKVIFTFKIYYNII